MSGNTMMERITYANGDVWTAPIGVLRYDSPDPRDRIVKVERLPPRKTQGGKEE